MKPCSNTGAVEVTVEVACLGGGEGRAEVPVGIWITWVEIRREEGGDGR